MKKSLKKILAATSAAVVMATFIPTLDSTLSTTVIAASTYSINKTVPVFGNAQDAQYGRNALKTYPAGEYYIYKTFDGMYNITKVAGTPGAWMNPADNSSSSPEETKPAPTEPIITSPIKTIPTTTAASTTKATVPEITKSITQAPETTPLTKTPVVGGTYTLYNSTAKYITADNARSKTGSLGTYNAGTYYIYKIYGGMINITKTAGVPGAWINPNTNTAPVVTVPTTTTPKTTTPVTSAPVTTTPVTTTPVTTTPVTTTPVTTTPETKPVTTTPVTSAPVVNGKYILSTSAAKYINAGDASSQINSVGSYAPGTYYVYKIYGGMLNISNTPGVPGAWINPGSTSGTPEATQPVVTVPGGTISKPANDNPLPAGYINFAGDRSNYITKQEVSIRSSIGGSVVKTLRYGTVVKLLTTSGSYSKVRYLGTNYEGWLLTDTIKRVTNNPEVVPKAGGNGYVIGIEIGHESDDKGASGYYGGRTYHELDMNWQVAIKTKEVMEKMGFTVVLTQKSTAQETYIYEKATVVNQAEVDYAVSIHHNAGGGQGSLVLYNAIKNNPTATQNISAGKLLGQMISNELGKVTGSSYAQSDISFYGDSYLKTNFSIDAPSALLELGYMDNSYDLSIITSSAGQYKFANAIANGIVNTINARK